MEVQGSPSARLSLDDFKRSFLFGLAVFVAAGAVAAAQYIAGQDYGPWGTLIVALLIFVGDMAKRFMSDTTMVKVSKLSPESRAGQIVAYREGRVWRYGVLKQWLGTSAVISNALTQFQVEVKSRRAT